MKRTTVLLAAIAFCAVGTAFADYSFRDEGTWPKTWPKELEPLRKISRTLIGNKQLLRHYAIPFTDRDEFESAWPHILKVKSKGTSLRLMRGPDFFLSGGTAGVVLHCPPENKSDEPVTLDLVVDGAIVDLNRIPLPPDTPINDGRFKDAKNK
jgi:hypothetical protein